MVSYVAKPLHFTHATFTPTSFNLKKKEIKILIYIINYFIFDST